MLVDSMTRISLDNTSPLDVPPGIHTSLQAAASTGARQGLQAPPTPPTGSEAQAELRVMHEVAATRTDAGATRARYLQRVGEGALWRSEFERLNAAAPIADAAAGAALLERALTRAGTVSHKLKRQHERARPYDVDPTLTTAVRKPGGATSFPSSHSACAFAGAHVLASIWATAAPHESALAEEVAYSRVYGGVHFPSDVAAGAMIGVAAAADVLAAAPATTRG